jgi:hypothetical protein
VQVVSQEPVVAGQRDRGVGWLAGGLVGEGGQVQGRRPALGTAGQLLDLGMG